MKKQQNQSALVNCEALLAIDIGFGHVKALLQSGRRVIFPSVAGRARPLGFHADEILKRHSGDQVNAWFVGELALSQLLPGELVRLRGRNSNDYGTEFRLRMFQAALGKLFAGVFGGDAMVINLTVATGLPISHMGDAAHLKSALIGAHRVTTDAADFVANVGKVYVMPQAYAAIYTLLLNEDGSVNASQTATETAVIDVGTYTLDFARDSNGLYLALESGSVEAGVHNVHERVSKELQEIYKQEFSPKVVDDVVRTKRLKVMGRNQDCTPIVEEACQALRESCISKAHELWHDAMHIEEIYLMGGGAPLVVDVLTSEFRQLKVLHDPQWANTEGYMRYALFKQSQ